MTEEIRYQLIESWLAGELSGKPLKEFEAQLQTNEQLALEVEVIRDLSNLNQATPRNQIRKTISEIRLQNEKKRTTIAFNWWWRRVAAGLLFLVAGYFVFNLFYKNDAVDFVENMEPIIETENETIIELVEKEAVSKIDSIKVLEKNKVEKETKKIIYESKDSNPIVYHEIEKKSDFQEEPIVQYVEPQIVEYEIIAYSNEVSKAQNYVPMEEVPDYVSKKITDIQFFEPDHEPTLEEIEAEKETQKELERMAQLSMKNIKRDTQFMGGDTVFLESAVASAVMILADVPEKRINYLLESEKERIEKNQSKKVIQIDSIELNSFYDSTYKVSLTISGKWLLNDFSNIGFYVFSFNPYDFINDEYLFFEKLKWNSNNDFSINAKLDKPFNVSPYFNLYGVFIEMETGEILAIERVQTE